MLGEFPREGCLIGVNMVKVDCQECVKFDRCGKRQYIALHGFQMDCQNFEPRAQEWYGVD